MLTIIFCRRNVDATKTHSGIGLDIGLDIGKEKDINNIIVSKDTIRLINQSYEVEKGGRKHHASRQTIVHAGRYC